MSRSEEEIMARKIVEEGLIKIIQCLDQHSQEIIKIYDVLETMHNNMKIINDTHHKIIQTFMRQGTDSIN